MAHLDLLQELELGINNINKSTPQKGKFLPRRGLTQPNRNHLIRTGTDLTIWVKLWHIFRSWWMLFLVFLYRSHLHLDLPNEQNKSKTTGPHIPLCFSDIKITSSSSSSSAAAAGFETLNPPSCCSSRSSVQLSPRSRSSAPG